jgi:hypothetical protein
MPLSMRPTGPPSPVDRDRKDYTVYSGGWPMGRIYEERRSPEHLRWFWSIFGVLAKPADVRTDGRAPTLEAAKADLEASWRLWLAWAELSEKA